MLMQRLATSLRGLRAGQPFAILRNSTKQPARFVQSGGSLGSADESLLARQRRFRPVSPHLTIYRPQMTWYASAMNRITGSILSGAFYSYFFLYLVSPLFGWHIESKVLAEKFGHLNKWVKGALKFTVAMPFAFHSWNGIRHLVWDMGYQFGKQQVVRTGWFVVGLTVASSALLAVY